MMDWNNSIWNLPIQSLKTLHLHYQSAYGHQTWQGGDLPLGASTYKVTWLCDHIIFWINAANCISTIRVPMAIEFHIIVTYRDGLPLIKSNGNWIMWSLKIRWQTKIIISSLLKSLWPHSLAGWLLTWRSLYP